jgi:hypothetical protein
MRVRRMFLVLVVAVASSASAADTVRSLVESARLPELRWPDVSDYKRHLDSFYRNRNDALAWTHDGAATPQAVAITKRFAAADAKGVNATDYYGDRWAGRI